MPEKPEVLTVVKALKNKLIGKKIIKCEVYWNNIIVKPSVLEFCNQIVDQEILEITSRGKWIIIELSHDFLLVHLRMEGKFFFRERGVDRNKHEHVIFTLNDSMECRYADVRKFGKMYLLDKKTANIEEPLKSLGYEFDDLRLTKEYLKEKFSRKNLPIKTVLLDQTIIAGIGNIYDDEILFLSKLSPLAKAKTLSLDQCNSIIQNTKLVLEKAIAKGGTTIRSYTSEEGVHGRFQNELLVHGKKDELCPICHTKIQKMKVNGRGTYYCPNCQKEK